ncbi:MAG: hypothetical protein EOO09_21575 [Chitinophagaceae bacterium]|nr:MAG: hypothetical protein EOO09_21575 [Chitinophagaceae bacterium]
MKRIFATATVFVTLGFVKLAEDIISTLGLSQYTARTYILGNLAGDFSNDGETTFQEDDGADMYSEINHFKTPYVKDLKAIITGDKVAYAKSLCEYVKTFVNSEEFAAQYQGKREKAKPTQEPWRPDAEQMAAFRKDLKDSEKSLADMKKEKTMAAYIPQMEEGVKKQRQQLAGYEDPHPNLTKWQRAYPADPAVMVKARLEEYLLLVGSVDFNATLTETGRKKKFTNPDYEKKSRKWKAMYRAGREVNTAVTAFVKEWLKGEIVAKQKVKMPAGDNSTGTASGSTFTKKELVEQVLTGDSSSTNSSDSPGKKQKKSSLLIRKLKDKIN